MKTRVNVGKKIRNGKIYEINVNLTKIGDQKPYFSVLQKTTRCTKSGSPDKRYRPCECACSKHVESVFPELKELFEFHLRNEDGSPMYEIENTLYFMRENNVEAVMNQLLITENEAKKLIRTIDGNDKEGLAEYIRANNLKAKWLSKANELKGKYNIPLSVER